LEELVFACTLKPVLEWGEFYSEEGVKERYGRYHNSNFRIPGFGKTAWVVAAHIIGDIDKYLLKGYNEQDIVDACLRDLNRPPRKRARKPRFGDKLSVHNYKFLKDEEGGTYISVGLITNKKRNKSFWGKGQKLYTNV
jgi:hypothetical protein